MSEKSNPEINETHIQSFLSLLTTSPENINNSLKIYKERLQYLEPLITKAKNNKLEDTKEFKAMFQEYVEIMCFVGLIELSTSPSDKDK